MITLGIIGVVAAMTLSTLIQNYQKKTYVEGLKVAVSMFENGFKKAMADDEVDDLRNTELFEFCNWDSYEAEPQKCLKMLNKYFKIIKWESENDLKALGDINVIPGQNASLGYDQCKQLVGKVNKWWLLGNKSQCSGTVDSAFTFANGMRADFALYDYGWRAGFFTVDINGGKGPNTWGRDAFQFNILNNGQVVPTGGRASLRAYYNGQYPEVEQSDYQFYIEHGCNPKTSLGGAFCAVRVIEENNWKMDY